MNNVYLPAEDPAFSKTPSENSASDSRRVGNYFIFMAVYSLFANVLFRLIRPFYEGIESHSVLETVFFGSIYDCAVRAILFVPVFAGALIVRKKLKQERAGAGVLLFDAVGFVVLLCGLILPTLFAFIAPSYEGEFAGLFGLALVSLCILLCGVFFHKKALKIAAYLYFLLAALPLAAMRFYLACMEFVVGSSVYIDFVNWYSYVQIVLYGFYPILGYGLVGVSLKKTKKEQKPKNNPPDSL